MPSPRLLAALTLGLVALVAVPADAGLSVGGSGPAPTSATSAVQPATLPGASTSVRIAAVADSVCDPASSSYNGGAGVRGACRAAAVVSRIASFAPSLVLVPGDAQYESGTLSAYRTAFASAYAPVLSRVRAVPGNHDYRTPGAAGFTTFFADRLAAGRTWYSMDRPGWHLVGLDSNCEYVGCSPTSAQGTWLRRDLAASGGECTIAFWHHPIRSSGPHGSTSSDLVRPLWRMAAQRGVDIVLNGHDHLYERFAKRDGIRAFTVGAGGKDLYPVSSVASGSRFIDNRHFGVLILDLRPGAYSWRYVTAAGRVVDSGSGRCA